MKGRRIKYSESELSWVKDNCQLSRSELAARFCEHFDRRDVTSDHIKALCSRNGWSAGKAGKMRNAGKSLIFSTDEIAWIRTNAHLPRSEVHAAFQAKFDRKDISLQQILAWRKRNGVQTGRTGRFEKGAVPWSKGRKIGSHPNSAKTQFKIGQTPPNRLPMWSERVRDDGYVEMKVPLPNPYTNAKSRFIMKHIFLWEQVNGPVPKGYALKALDGDRGNTCVDNWEAVPRGLLPRLNGKSGRDYDNSPTELQPTILATAKLEHAARGATNHD